MDTLLSAPMGLVHYLYYTAVQEAQTDEGKAEQQKEAMEDAMDDMQYSGRGANLPGMAYVNASSKMPRGGVKDGSGRVPPGFVLRSKTTNNR